MSEGEQLVIGDRKARAIASLRETIATEGWTTVVVPTVRRWLMDDLEALSNWKKPEGQDDSYQRGLVARDKAFLGTWTQLINEFESEVEQEQREQEPPAVGTPYAPENNSQDGKV